ncbi:hypothetical protein [uncultured Acidaminococcus sp.]|uniref:gp53-like domain-containing protein n=1 Tax=uncultured Acidaminococcus sp. TaxID=352152 RepID=UPI002666C48D|nr:hypothetical protein [uncultured Acidaminococcus sp.]
MSVLKSILHHWNSTNKAYDTLHPETEAAQVTDWHESVIGSLASKVLPTVVSELTTDSVMGKLMKMLLTASGVKYSIDTNGYVCLGSFFGGLIIQWGTTGKDEGVGATRFVYPITCTPLSAVASCTSISNDPSDAAIATLMNNSCDIDVKQSAYAGAYRVIIIGRS